MNIKKTVNELNMLNPTQRHIFFENFSDKIPGIEFKRHPYQNMQNVDIEKTVLCRDSFRNCTYLMELIETSNSERRG